MARAICAACCAVALLGLTGCRGPGYQIIRREVHVRETIITTETPPPLIILKDPEGLRA